jgi:hypothetical protein
VLALSCTSQKQWKHSEIHGATAQFSSHRLTYSEPHSFCPIQLEIIRKSNSLKGYLLVQQKPLPPHENDPEKSLISVEIEGLIESHFVIRYKDGYKAIIPEDLLKKILNALSQGIPAIISCSNHKLILSPEGFLPKYQQFQKNRSLPQLIHSPF